MRLRMIAFCLGLLALHASSASAEDYPSRPIRIIVPSAAGGGFDLTARIISEKLSETLGKPVVVENRTGAGTLIGTQAVTQMPADGYTLLLGGVSNIALNPGLYKKLPYDPLKDFVPVTLAVNWSFTLVARKNLPMNTLPEVIAYAKAHPGELTYASAGNGTGQHIAMATTATLAGVKLTHIPYRGAAEAMQDVLAGRDDLFFDNTASSLSQVRAGAVKTLAVSSAKRQAVLPDVPSVMETGVAPLDMVTWFGLFARSGTPDAVIAKVRDAMKVVLADPKVVAVFEKTGGNVMHLSPEETETLVKHDVERWTKLLHEAGISLD
ncbi:MAG TPA: tripartite tricarboxylate transporter substrate binding protein [Pseudolabrys sp.]